MDRKKSSEKKAGMAGDRIFFIKIKIQLKQDVVLSLFSVYLKIACFPVLNKSKVFVIEITSAHDT